MFTYAVQHPAMSHALLMESQVERNERALAAWGVGYILRHFDEVLDPDEFIVREVLPGTPDTYSIFE